MHCLDIVAAWPPPHYLPEALLLSTTRRPAWLLGWDLCPNLIPRNGRRIRISPLAPPGQLPLSPPGVVSPVGGDAFSVPSIVCV